MKGSIARCNMGTTSKFKEWLSMNTDRYTDSRLILQGATQLISFDMWCDFMNWLNTDSKKF